MSAKRSTNTSKTSPEKLSAKEKALEALALRKTGMSFQEIAAEIGYKTESGARNAVNRLLARTEFEAVADYRKLKLLQLDELYQAVAGELVDKDKRISLWAVDRLQNIIDQQSRLLGLYASTKIEVTDWRGEAIRAIRANEVDYEELAEELGENLAEQLFREAGVQIKAG